MALSKKPHPKFNVPNYGAKGRKGVKARWRKQRGIDSKKRIKKDFMGAEPTIGYRNPESLRGVRVDGKAIRLVHSMAELKALLEKGEGVGFNVTISGAVSRRKKAEMTKAAAAKGVRVTNGVIS